jgi:hypothetical protein
MIQDIADALVQSWRNFASAFVLFVPQLVAATIKADLVVRVQALADQLAPFRVVEGTEIHDVLLSLRMLGISTVLSSKKYLA